MLKLPAKIAKRIPFPGPALATRIVGEVTEILRTDLDGAVTVRLAASGVQAAAERAERPRYWRHSRSRDG